MTHEGQQTAAQHVVCVGSGSSLLLLSERSQSPAGRRELNSFTPYLFQMSRENGPGVTLER